MRLAFFNQQRDRCFFPWFFPNHWIIFVGRSSSEICPGRQERRFIETFLAHWDNKSINSLYSGSLWAQFWINDVMCWKWEHLGAPKFLWTTQVMLECLSICQSNPSICDGRGQGWHPTTPWCWAGIMRPKCWITQKAHFRLVHCLVDLNCFRQDSLDSCVSMPCHCAVNSGRAGKPPAL